MNKCSLTVQDHKKYKTLHHFYKPTSLLCSYMNRPFADIRPIGPFSEVISDPRSDKAENFDTEIRYDILHDERLSDEQKGKMEEILNDAASSQVTGPYQVIVADAGLQTASFIRFKSPIGATTMSNIHEEVIDEMAGTEINAAQNPFIQSSA